MFRLVMYLQLLGNKIDISKIKKQLLDIGAFDIDISLENGIISASLTVESYCKLQYELYNDFIKCINSIKENNRNIKSITFSDDFELIKVYGDRLSMAQRGAVLLDLFSYAKSYQTINNQFFVETPITIEFYTSKGKFLNRCSSNEPSYNNGENSYEQN